MNSFVVVSCLLAAAAASASASLVAVPHVTTTQYHAQDELGQYSYGYSGGPSSKEETRTADGVTRGSYSYVDANGVVQSASYVADPVHGFRVAATNLPQAPAPAVAAAPVVLPAVHAAPAYVPAPALALSPGFDHVNGVPLETPEVQAAKAAHFAAHGEALARLGRRWKRSLAGPAGKAYSYSTFTPSGSTTVVDGPSVGGRSFSYSTVASAPVVAAAPAHVAYSAPAVAVAPAAAYVAGPVAAGRSFSYSTVAAAPVAPVRFFSYSPAVTYSAPLVTAGVPLASQYRVQDDFGQYTYGYSDGLSSKTESRTADGTTHGKYSYLDSNGIVQSVKYVADAGGFRVHATNLPVGPSA